MISFASSKADNSSKGGPITSEVSTERTFEPLSSCLCRIQMAMLLGKHLWMPEIHLKIYFQATIET
jgi:hypothetical protein